MPLNSFTVGLTIGGDLPEPSGPDDLSSAIIDLRKSLLEQHDGDVGWLSPISDAGIRRLIKLAFYTSLAAEEGRYPRFRLINRIDHGADTAGFAAAFDTPINDVESLRRLAPAASETDGALLIIERADSLLCTGSLIVSDMGFGTRIGRPEIVGVGRSPSLIIRVDGPGSLRATDTVYTLLLNRGRIRQVVDYWLVRQVQGLWNELASHIAERTASIYGDESRRYFGGLHTLAQLIHKAWSRVLATAIDKHHGGMFVVLPGMENPENFDIHCKYLAQMQFGDDIREFWGSCIRHSTARDDRGREDAIHAWNWRRAAMFAKAGILAGLSSIDGCVVLDRSLQILGFGGEIRVNDQNVQNAPRTLTNLKTGQPTSEGELERMGTRHRNAYRLAKVHPGTIVFVISQDGELRIFCSDESNVFGFDGLHAWVHEYESQ